jgi:branched-chain amino acid transport system ATP-binding protein
VSGLLAVEALQVRYGRVRALNGVDLELEPGRVLAVLGRNGAGKSSLLGAVAGLVSPNRGRVAWDGVDVTRMPADRRARRGIALVPEGRRIFANVTVRENLALGAFLRPAAERDGALERVLAVFPALAERIDAGGGELSGGQQQMLAIGRALMGEPRVLLLDEPSLGLAPRAVENVYAQLRRLKADGIGMVVVEQQVGRALELADDAMVLNLGEVVLRASPDQLRDDPRLVGAYLGTKT